MHGSCPLRRRKRTTRAERHELSERVARNPVAREVMVRVLRGVERDMRVEMMRAGCWREQ